MRKTPKAGGKSAERNKGQQGALRSTTNKDGTPKVKPPPQVVAPDAPEPPKEDNQPI